MTDVQHPHHHPGRMPGPTALRSLLSAAGVTDPSTGSAFSEAMVFGIAGGIGAGVFAFHYPKENLSTFFLAGRHLWQDHLAWASAAVPRFGASAVVKESSGAKPAEKQLRELLKPGRPVMAWITFRGRMYHLVTIHGIDDAAGVALIGDLGKAVLPVPLAELAEARARVRKDKHRLLALDSVRRAPDVTRAVREGLAACAGSLRKARMKNFTLEAFATWADRLDGSKAADAWERVFPPGPQFQSGLRSISDCIESTGKGGGLCRAMFAEFLTEAGTALGDRSLAALAPRYAELGRDWTALAKAALPEEGVPPDAAGCAALRRDLKRRVTALYEGEKAALEALAGWL